MTELLEQSQNDIIAGAIIALATWLLIWIKNHGPQKAIIRFFESIYTSRCIKSDNINQYLDALCDNIPQAIHAMVLGYHNGGKIMTMTNHKYVTCLYEGTSINSTGRRRMPIGRKIRNKPLTPQLTKIKDAIVKQRKSDERIYWLDQESAGEYHAVMMENLGIKSSAEIFIMAKRTMILSLSVHFEHSTLEDRDKAISNIISTADKLRNELLPWV